MLCLDKADKNRKECGCGHGCVSVKDLDVCEIGIFAVMLIL